MKSKNVLFKEYIDEIESYIRIVVKVHGRDHMEIYEVERIFDELLDKTKSGNLLKVGLETEFIELNNITNNYSLPSGVCETYERVYTLLKELNRLYFS